jgi:hypothetical protein
MVRYRSQRDDDGAIQQRIWSLAAERRLFGHRRLRRLLGCEGVVIPTKANAEKSAIEMQGLLLAKGS